MSTDQWDPDEIVQIRMVMENGKHEWSDTMPRKVAELHISSGEWLMYPTWEVTEASGKTVKQPVVSAKIVKYTFN
jgi:hypothetical protein